MPFTNRVCAWCGQRELYPTTFEEFNQWLERPKGCCAPDGDGHLWRQRYPHEIEKDNEPDEESLLCGVKYIISRTWADKHLNSDDDLKYFNGKAEIR